MTSLKVLSVSVLLAVAACSSSSSPSAAPDASTVDPPTPPAPPPTPDTDGGTDAAADAPLTGKCADTFGTALTAGFGRIDGIVYAVQKPTDTTCALPNSDHLIVQVLMGGAVYRMVINVQGSGTDSRIWNEKIAHALPAPAFAEGWHLGAGLDYVTDLGVHTTDVAFTPYDITALVTELASQIHVGDAISVYATVGDGYTDSAHLVHRNKVNEDGAVVIAPKSATPSLLVFHFAEQTF